MSWREVGGERDPLGFGMDNMKSFGLFQENAESRNNRITENHLEKWKTVSVSISVLTAIFQVHLS